MQQSILYHRGVGRDECSFWSTWTSSTWLHCRHGLLCISTMGRVYNATNWRKMSLKGSKGAGHCSCQIMGRCARFYVLKGPIQAKLKDLCRPARTRRTEKSSQHYPSWWSEIFAICAAQIVFSTRCVVSLRERETTAGGNRKLRNRSWKGGARKTNQA